MCVPRFFRLTFIWVVFCGAPALWANPELQAADVASNRPNHDRPNIIIILADDLGFSDVGCYGSEIPTPNLDRLAADGLRFTQFYNAARCCPTRAALLTGLYPHQAGVGHMLEDWLPPHYSTGLLESCATIGELLQAGGYRTYHVGKWHVGGFGKQGPRNRPNERGFDRAYGTAGGGNHYKPQPLYLDRENLTPDEAFYSTDAFTEYAVRFLEEHPREHAAQPFFLHLCYTAPHFPLQAKLNDVIKHLGRYRDGWDALRERRYTRQKQLGIVSPNWLLSPRDPVAAAWSELSHDERDEWDLRMAVYAGMIDCLDQGIGRVLDAVRAMGAEHNTVVMFLSDNGASAEFLDSWPNPARGHEPGSLAGTRESHRCLEIGWANAANTPFREHKMWVHEGGISTPLIVRWPRQIRVGGGLTRQVGHVIDLMPTCLELAHLEYPAVFHDRELTPLPGRSLMPVFQGASLGPRVLAWEHDGNRAIRSGDWKLVSRYDGDWELYDLHADRTELHNLASQYAGSVELLAAQWQAWADQVGVAPLSALPKSTYKPDAKYRRKSEPPAR